MADDTKMPEVARRRGGADTLFSAEWFDDNDEFTGAKPEGVREKVSIPSGGAEAPVVPPVEEPPAATGPSMGVLIGGLAVLFFGGGCLLGVVAAGAAYAFGLIPT